jgi:hypothetical protein
MVASSRMNVKYPINMFNYIILDLPVQHNSPASPRASAAFHSVRQHRTGGILQG